MTSVFGHSVRWELLLLWGLEAITCFCAMTLLLFWSTTAPHDKIVVFSLLLSFSCALISGASGLYQPEAWSRTQRLLLRTAVAGAILLIVWPLLRFTGLDHLDAYRLEILFAFAATVLGTRLAIAAATRHGLLRHRIVAVRPLRDGGADSASSGRPEGDRADLETVEVITALDTGGGLEGVLKPDQLRAMRIRTVVVPDPLAVSPETRRLCTECGIRVVAEGEFREQRLARVDIEALPADWLRAARALRFGRAEALLHRMLDLLAGLILLCVTLPLLLATALAIKLESRGPIFYRQERVGRGGRTFMLLKFRSMRVDAEAAGRAVWASQHDPRVTRVGRIIRRCRIDEIPQVLNVLRGDMAFVGPRPERPAFVEQLRRQIPHYDDRAVVKPGITGWAQVNYPYGASVEDARMKLAYDLYYVKRRSLFLDLLILVATVRVVLFQEGAR